MTDQALDVRRWVTLGTAAFVLTSALWIGLFALATPKNAAVRLQRVHTTLEEAERAVARGGDVERLSPQAICPSYDAGAALGKAMAASAAARAKVDLSEARFSTLATPTDHAALATLGVDISAQGQEAPLKAFLRDLASRNPVIIADAVDLQTDGAAVSLRLKGRLLCHAHRFS